MRGDINDASDDEDAFFGDDNEDNDNVLSEARPGGSRCAVRQAGYRDGKAKAEEEIMQQGFDDGFEQGMVLGRRVGRLYALLREVLLKHYRNGLPENQRPSSNTTTTTAALSLSPQESVTVQSSLRKNSEIQGLHQQCVKLILEALPEAYSRVKKEEERRLIEGESETAEAVVDALAVNKLVDEIFLLSRTIVGKVFDMKDNINKQSVERGQQILRQISALQENIPQIR